LLNAAEMRKLSTTENNTCSTPERQP